MKPLGLFCRNSGSTAAGELASAPKIRVTPSSEPQPPVGLLYSAVSTSDMLRDPELHHWVLKF